jgi:hypothetical protein
MRRPQDAIDEFPVNRRAAQLEGQKAFLHDCQMLPAFGPEILLQIVLQSDHRWSFEI